MVEELTNEEVEGGGEEEIIEKKPFAPTATVLMILTTVFLGFAIYLTGDEISYYFNPKDYESDIRADYHYSNFAKTKRPEHVQQPTGESGLGR
jgi:hypothetical protein